MYCINCGKENQSDANYCYKCGRQISNTPVPDALLADLRSPAVATAEFPPTPVVDKSTTQEQFRKILDGRYELKEMLGTGGMGVVYKAYDRQLGMDIAIKFLLECYINNIDALASLKREAKAAMQLAHPNIVRLFNFEHTLQVKYLLMEFVEGDSLAAIKSRKPNNRFLDIEVMRYAAEVCEALTYAHSKNIVHRDIKPSNILITQNGTTKLTDFGVAYIHEAASFQFEGEGGGTPFYMSPEQILGRQTDGRSDIYSLGIMMYELLAGYVPFRWGDIKQHHLHTMPDPIEHVSDWMNAVVLKCLKKEAESRWQTAEELRDVLNGNKDIGIPFRVKFQTPWARVAADRSISVSKKKSSKKKSDPEVKKPEVAPVKVSLIRNPGVLSMEKPDLSPVKKQEDPPVKVPRVSSIKVPKGSPVKVPKGSQVKVPKGSQVKVPKGSTIKEPQVSSIKEPQVSPITEPKVSSGTVNKSPTPPRGSGAYERIDSIKRRAGFINKDPKKEQARVGWGTLAGLCAGVILMKIAENPNWSLSNGFLFRVCWMIYGGLIGCSIGIARGEVKKCLISTAMGLAGGMVACLLMNVAPPFQAVLGWPAIYFAMLCGAAVGAFLGIADGAYERDFVYMTRSVFWGAIGGAIAVAGFSLMRSSLSGVWWQPLTWLAMGVSLGFFTNMGLGIAEKPWTKK